MTYSSIIPIILIALLILLVAIVMVIAITGNFKVGQRFRDELAQRIRFLRLNKMLAKRNIVLKHYLHAETVTNIENQIRSCESCSVTKECDQALKDSSTDDLSFCPNHEDFESIDKRK